MDGRGALDPMTPAEQEAELAAWRERAAHGEASDVEIREILGPPPAVTTRSYDNARSGATTDGVLTADAVQARGIRRAFSIPLAGDRRGVEAQPLAVPAVRLAGGTVRDVIVLADMANNIRAVDAASGELLWERPVGRPVDGIRDIDAYLVNDQWGVLGTPVIDIRTATVYLVAWISRDGSVASARHVCFALSLRDGSDVHDPLDLEGVVFEPGHGLAPLSFASVGRKQRPGLLLTDVDGVTTVFIGFGSLHESGDQARGWVVACGTAPFEVTAAWCSTARHAGGGIWQGAAGLAADASGRIHLMTGNGAFDGVTDLAESFVELAYTPPRAAAPAALTAVNWWSPFRDQDRTGGTAPGATPPAAGGPTNTRAIPAADDMGEPWQDMDLGSGGPVILPEEDVVLGAGKDGILYTLPLGGPWRTTPADLAEPARNYAKLWSPAIMFTFYSPGLDSEPASPTELDRYVDDVTHHQHGGPVTFRRPDGARYLYCWGENGALRAWRVDDHAVTFLASGAETASPQSPVPYGGMPGGMISVSVHTDTAVVWATVPAGDANRAVTPGRLLAYDATRFDVLPDGSSRMRKLWDSQDWNIEFSFNKFNRPVVFDGRLYVPTYDATVDVYVLAGG